MFGFLISGEVNDDAVRLKTFVDMALNKYAYLEEYSDLKSAVEANFDKRARHTDAQQVSFVYPELTEFQFCLDSSKFDKPMFPLNVIGRGKYSGFMLTVIEAEKWNCSVSDGISYKATGGAKKLASIMEKKFDVLDMSKIINRYR